MILFKEKAVDEHKLFLIADESFKQSAYNLSIDNLDDYQDFFGHYDHSDLKTELARISYSKNFEIEDLFYFDSRSSFHFYVLLYVYAYDEDLDKDSLCSYVLMLDDDLNILDDFIR